MSGMTDCYLSNTKMLSGIFGAELLCSFIRFLRQLLSLYHYCRFLLHCLLMMRYLNHQETLLPLLSHLVNFRIGLFFSSTVLLLSLHDHNFWYLPFAVLNLAFALSILGFLIMHISLVAGNTTTIEVML